MCFFGNQPNLTSRGNLNHGIIYCMYTIHAILVHYDGSVATMYMMGGPNTVYAMLRGGTTTFTRCVNYRVGIPEARGEIVELASYISKRMGIRSPECIWSHTLGLEDNDEYTVVLDTWKAPKAKL